MNEADRRWLKRLRLDRDPFLEAGSGSDVGSDHAFGTDPDSTSDRECGRDFFARGSRERQLALLVDMSTLGRPLVAMVGEAGVGKTTLFHAVLERLPREARVAHITAGVFLSGRALLQSIARALDVRINGQIDAQIDVEVDVEVDAELDAEAKSEALRARLHATMIALQGSGTPCVVVVDDAGELGGEALHELIRLAELARHDGPGIRVILFSLPGIRQALTRAAGEARVDSLIHEMVLDRYSLDELRGYLQFRLARAGREGAGPFTEGDFQEIFRDSGGLPGRANAIAGRMLRERNTGVQPGRLLWIAASLTTSLLLGALVLMLLPGDEEQDGVSQREAAREQASQPPVAQARALPSAASSAPAAVEGLTAERPRAEDAAAARADEIAGPWLPLPVEAAGPAASGPGLDAGKDAASPDAGASADASSAPDARVAAAATDIGASGSVSPDDRTDPDDAYATGAPGESAGENRGESEGVSGRESGNRGGGGAETLDETRDATAGLRGADPEHYTLQVLVSSSESRASAWIAQQQLPQTFRQYRRVRDAAEQFVVVYGDFADLAAARSAAARVASQTGVAAPWIRPVRDVQDELPSRGESVSERPR